MLGGNKRERKRSKIVQGRRVLKFELGKALLEGDI